MGIKFRWEFGGIYRRGFCVPSGDLAEQYVCRWDEFLRDFHLSLSGAAQKWYWQFQRSHYRPDYPMLPDALMRRFRNSKSDYEIMRDMMDRKHGAGETSDEYFAAVNRLRSQLRVQIPEMELVQILKRNLNRRLSQMVYPQAIYTLDQLRRACKDAELAFPDRDRESFKVHRPTNRYVANELEMDDEDGSFGDEQVAAFQQSGARPKASRAVSDSKFLTCWNCKQQGHAFMDCPSTTRNLFCYRCCSEGVITPRC